MLLTLLTHNETLNVTHRPTRTRKSSSLLSVTKKYGKQTSVFIMIYNCNGIKRFIGTVRCTIPHPTQRSPIPIPIPSQDHL